MPGVMRFWTSALTSRYGQAGGQGIRCSFLWMKKNSASRGAWKWRVARDSNPRDAFTPISFQDCRLRPLGQPPRCFAHLCAGSNSGTDCVPKENELAGVAGLEPAVHGTKNRCLTNLATPQQPPLVRKNDNQEMSVIQPRIPPLFSVEDSCPWSRPVGKTGRPGFPGLSGCAAVGIDRRRAENGGGRRSFPGCSGMRCRQGSGRGDQSAGPQVCYAPISRHRPEKAGRAWYWRAGRDLNPRNPFRFAGFRNRCIRPLCHLPGKSVVWLAPLLVKADAKSSPSFF